MSVTETYKIVVAFFGIGAIAFGCLTLDFERVSWGFALLVGFTILAAPRLNVTLPHSNLTLSFSDSLIFLAFLMVGGEGAIVIGAVEMVANCVYLRRKGVEFGRFSIAFNVGSVGVSTLLTSLVWSALPIVGVDVHGDSTSALISTLGFLGLVQFLSVSIIVSTLYSLGSNHSVFAVWKNEFLPSSITTLLGAGLAGIVYKLLNYGDFLTIGISLVVFAVVYLTYRHIIAEMTRSIDQAEEAEREKTDAERQKRLEVEKFAEDLTAALKKEEETGKALRKSRKAFQHAALHDSLTKLPNRAFFGEMLRRKFDTLKATDESKSFVLFLDLARFKTVNDSLGHTMGDKVLILVARRFQRLQSPDDMVARLGGDEFAIMLNGLRSLQEAELAAWDIHQKLSQSFSITGNKINIGVNIGIAPFSPDYENPEDVLRDADIAMHHAKTRGSGVEVFSPDLRLRFVERAQIEADLPFAIERGELTMNYQPIVSLKDGGLIGFEALLRWNHSERGFISPAEFIPVAEETGHIIPITTWILRETCLQLAKWQKTAPYHRQLIMSVNISGKHLSYQSLLVDVEMALENARLAPSSLKLEITESAAMENAEQTIRMLSHLKSLGVQLSIDDFGTGYSSLSYLHRLPVDTLKIDRSFVNSVGENGEDSEILQTIISLAKNLKMRVIAEGIETAPQLELLRNLGCDYGQGYFMSRPLSKDLMGELLLEKSLWIPEEMVSMTNDAAQFSDSSELDGQAPS